MDEIENSVNQMYGALTKLSKRSESSASEIEGRVLELQEVAKQIGRDAELLNQTAAHPSDLEPILPFFSPHASLESAPTREVLNGNGAVLFNQGASQPESKFNINPWSIPSLACRALPAAKW